MVTYNQLPSNKIYSNDKFREMRGYLEDREAKASFAEFMYNNLGFMVEVMMGIKLFPFQNIILRSWFDHNFNLAVWARGASKSSLVSIFCCLYPLFNPECKIVIASNAFRSTRRLILQMEKMINSKNAKLLKACFPLDGNNLRISRRGDEWLLPILNGGSIMALPLNEGVRGTRADVLIIDEALLVPEEIYSSVLVPFLGAQSNITEQLKIDSMEDRLIKEGKISEEKRTLLESKKKIIGLTSASYDFEFIFRWYNDWIDKVLKPNPKENRTYFVSRLGYRALPSKLIDKSIPEMSKSGGEDSAHFKREWDAMFSSSSDGYFNYKKLQNQTIKDGDIPTVQLQGNPDSKYILSIDPSFSGSKSSDNFAMGVYLINSDTRTITQVHTYAVAGGDLSTHLQYLAYILMHFNIVYLIADLGGANFNFIETANESGLFIDKQIKLQFFEGNFDDDNYLQELQKVKNTYRLLDRKICYRQIFTAEWLRKSNEYLQSQIDSGKIWFASNICSHPIMSKRGLASNIPLIVKDENNKVMDILDFMAYQDDNINQTKRELALIEVKSSNQGTMHFDLPLHLRRSTDNDRSRKDRYTCLLMACWGAKCWFDMTFQNLPSVSATFSPRMIS